MVNEKPTYAQINRKVWNTCRFRSLSPEARELFFYLTTCPHGNMLGLFVLRPGYALDDLQWGNDRERFMKPFGELLAKQLFKYDPKAEIVLDMEQISKHPPDNPNQVKATIKIINSLPKTPLFDDLKQLVESLGRPLLKPLAERLAERYAYSVTETVTVTVTELESFKKDSSPMNGDKCPHQKIIDLYHLLLPALPKIKSWPESLQKILRTRWKEDSERQDLQWWEKYFKYVHDSDFLMGKAGEFTADLEWIIRPKNMTKIINGRYHGSRDKHAGIKAWLNEGGAVDDRH